MNSDRSRRKPDGKDYDVGYKKPPKHSRFQKGESGNPRGRPKGQRNHRSIIKSVLERTVTIRENGRSREVSFFEAFVHKLVERGLHGTTNDQLKLLQMIEQYVPELVAPQEAPDRIEIVLVKPDGSEEPCRPPDQGSNLDPNTEADADM